MAYRAGDVRPGKCFVTGGDMRLQLRRVRSVSDGMVNYEGRDPKTRRGQWGSPMETSMEQFLAEAAREVGSDYAP